MKNKKGFTLIELLAIIVILAIIAVITVPIILNIIENSKKGAAQDCALGYKDGIQKYYTSRLFQDSNEQLPSGIKLVSALPSDFEVSGEKPTNDSWIELEKGNVVAYSLKFGDYTVTKYKDSEVVCEKGNVQENEDARIQRLASEAADTYVKSALTKYYSLRTETVKTVVQMTDEQLTKPENLAINGWIFFDYDSINGLYVVDYSLKFVDYVVNYASLTDGNYVSSITTGNERNKPPVVGDHICYGEECFKVIKKYVNSETGVRMAVLLADYNLKKTIDSATNVDIYKQEATTPDTVRFVTTSCYWIVNNELSSIYSNNGAYSYISATDRFVDTNNTQVYPDVYSSNSNIYTYVEGYLTILKTATYGLPSTAVGRLLTYNEFNALDISVRSNGKDYWSGSAYGGCDVRYASGNAMLRANAGNRYGVRPVIMVPVMDL